LPDAVEEDQRDAPLPVGLEPRTGVFPAVMHSRILIWERPSATACSSSSSSTLLVRPQVLILG
jgi:hypothetical protein